MQALGGVVCTARRTRGFMPDDLIVWRKGSANIRIAVKGRSAHAGVAPQDGRNAATELLHQLSVIDGAFPHAGTGTTVNLTASGANDGSALVHADSTSTADANASGGSGGGVAVNVFLPSADLAGTTRAYVGEGSSVINISSVVTSLNPPASAVYTATKGAVDSITGVLANELGSRKIRVNAINPGIVETEGTHTAGFIGSDFEAGAVAQTPLGRTGQTSDIAGVAVFLASDDSRWLTGEKISASGGLR